jgi:release factor glutamine methyltransferase
MSSSMRSRPTSALASSVAATTDRATWRDLRARAERVLESAGMSGAAVEARWLVEEASGYERADLVAAERESAPARGREQLNEMVARRCAGEPIQYVLGSWAFRGLDLYVDRRVLIPRPETEITAEVAIQEAQRIGARRGAADPWASPDDTTYTVADLGTGCGALALSLAAELPDAHVWATDVSADALAVARANLAGAGLPATRVRLAEGDWFDALPPELCGRLRMIVTNPPYVAQHELDELPAEVVAYEPVAALSSGPTGFEALEFIVERAPKWLEPRGVLVCELAPHQAGTAIERARAAGFGDAVVRPDLVGRDRVLVARLSG